MKKERKHVARVEDAPVVDEPVAAPTDMEVLLTLARGLGSPIKAIETRRRNSYFETAARVELKNEDY